MKRDRHLNLFYTYNTHHLEDNVTRALVITLKNLSPIYLRLFFEEVILKEYNAKHQMKKIQLNALSEPDFEFELQHSDVPEEGQKFNESNAVIVGVNYSSKQRLTLTQDSESISQGRTDAFITDKANEISFIFEIKLSDSLYKEQINRYFNQFFITKDICCDDVFVEISWNKIAECLSTIKRLNNNSHEQFIIDEFLDYLDYLGLVDFTEFKIDDFQNQSRQKFLKFVEVLRNELSEKFMFDESDGEIIFLKEIPYENLYINFDADGIYCGVVCGSGKKWRAEQIKNYLIRSKEGFNAILNKLYINLPSEFKLVLRVHSYFRLSYFRTAWLGNINGESVYPTEYSKFYETFTDDTINSFKKINKITINRVFQSNIAAEKFIHPKELDSSNMFPKWDEKEYLQYCYFHIDVIIPKAVVINKKLSDIIPIFERLVSELRNVMLDLDKIKG